MDANYVLESWTKRLTPSVGQKYYSNVEEFCNLMFNKSVTEINEDDISSILPMTVEERYIETLKNRELQNSTIKYKLKNISQFFKKLSINRVYNNINYALIIDEALSHRALRDDSGKTQTMTIEDMEAFKEWLVQERYTSKRYSYKGRKSAMLVDTLYITGSRISAMFDITWNDIKQIKDDFGNKTWVIHIIGKGNKSAKYPITDVFYNKMRAELFDNSEDDLVFKDISQRNFNNDMVRFAEEMGVEESFTPHSLRSLAITSVYKDTLDIHKTKEFANHDSVETTMGYIHDTNNFTETGSYLLSSERITIDDIAYMTKEQLLEIIGKRQDILNYVFRQGQA